MFTTFCLVFHRPRRTMDDSMKKDRLRRYAVTGTTMRDDKTTTTNSTDANSTEPVKENMFYESVVYGEELIIPGLGHFQEYNIEVGGVILFEFYGWVLFVCFVVFLICFGRGGRRGLVCNS